MGEFVLKYWIEFIFTGLVGLIGFCYKKIRTKQEEQEKKNKAIERGVQALLRNELIRRFREYKEKGEMSMLDKENMEHMFEEYFNLGGNGLMKEVHTEFLEIPIKIVK